MQCASGSNEGERSRAEPEPSLGEVSNCQREGEKEE